MVLGCVQSYTQSAIKGYKAPRMKASRITANMLAWTWPCCSPLWVLLFPHKTFIILEGSCCISHKNILFWTWVNYSLPYWKGPGMGHFSLLLKKKCFGKSCVGVKRWVFLNTVWIRKAQFQHVQDLKRPISWNYLLIFPWLIIWKWSAEDKL